MHILIHFILALKVLTTVKKAQSKLKFEFNYFVYKKSCNKVKFSSCYDEGQAVPFLGFIVSQV